MPTWEPKELGLPRATALAIILVALIGGFCYVAAEDLAPPKQPQVIQVTQAQLVQLPVPKPPPPPPPPPPKVVPPPKPLPVVVPKPPPIPSKIVVATKPPPPVHHIFKPVHKVIPRIQPPAPPPVTQPPPTPAPPQPPVERTDGEAAYGSTMHAIIQSNQDVPQALAQLGVSGTAIIRVEVAPNGHVVSAEVIRSSGVPLIDSTALDHVRSASFPPFNQNMPGETVAFTVPVEIDGENASQ
jgi:protein TonB